MLTTKEVLRLAAVSRILLSDEEAASITRELIQLLDFVSTMSTENTATFSAEERR